MPTNHNVRTPITMAEITSTRISSSPLLMAFSSHMPIIACGSWIPKSTNTKPLSTNESTRHTLDDTIFMRAIDGPKSRLKNE